MGKVITFINMKGGVGKTTIAVNIAYTLATRFDKRVLLIDLDPQMNATQYVLSEQQVRKILNNPRDTTLLQLFDQYTMPSIINKPLHQNTDQLIHRIDKNFDLIPSHLLLMDIQLIDKPFTIKTYIKNQQLRERYDVIIIDCPPTFSGFTKTALLTADAYIVPMKTEYLSFFGFSLLIDYIERLKREFEHELTFAGMLLSMVTPHHLVYKQVKEQIKRLPGFDKKKLFKNEFKLRTNVARANSPEQRLKKQNYIMNWENSKASEEMENITLEFIQRVKI